jgi:hypothetical protein
MAVIQLALTADSFRQLILRMIFFGSEFLLFVYFGVMLWRQMISHRKLTSSLFVSLFVVIASLLGFAILGIMSFPRHGF